MLPMADLHTHPLLPMYYFRKNLGSRHRSATFFPYTPLGTHIDIERLKESGVRLIVCSVYAVNRLPHRDCFEAAKSQIKLFDGWVSRHPETLAHAKTPPEIELIIASGKIAAVLALEGGHHLAGDLGHLEFFRQAGVAYLTLTHFLNTAVAESSLFAGFSAGPALRPFGRRLVEAMNREGMIIDLAHSSERAFWEVLECSKGPLIYSHGGAKPLCDHPRNLTDEQARALAQAGGLIGVILYPRYLRRDTFWGKTEDVIRHLEHWLSLVGPDRPCIGSDMGGVMVVREIRDYAGLPRLQEAIVKAFGETVARKILFENALSFLKQRWAGAVRAFNL